MANYSNYIIGSFALLGIGLLLAVVLQVRVALQPLKAMFMQCRESTRIVTWYMIFPSWMIAGSEEKARIWKRWLAT